MVKIDVTAMQFAKLIRNCVDTVTVGMCQLCPFKLLGDCEDDCPGIEHITDLQIVGSESDG